MNEDKGWNAAGFALFGSMFICYGSWIAYKCPTDGQTGAFVYPLYAIGGAMGLGAISMCRRYSVRWYIWAIVIVSALVAAGSILFAFLSMM